jgi:hypothetical protein
MAPPPMRAAASGLQAVEMLQSVCVVSQSGGGMLRSVLDQSQQGLVIDNVNIVNGKESPPPHLKTDREHHPCIN